MNTDEPANKAIGRVRYRDKSGIEQVVHTYVDDDYDLEDIHMLFGLGQLEPNGDARITITLTGSEVRNLKALADAQSFDHPEGFITMCLDIHAFVADRGEGPFVFHGDA